MSMAMIITVCPKTGAEIATGIETDPDTFARISSIVGRVWCVHCGTEHEWSTKTAYIREAGEPPAG
jgi:hypothetical protein